MEEKQLNELFYPDSLILIKKLQRKNNNKGFESKIIDYFSTKQLESYIFDTTNRQEFEIFNSLRIFIERDGRPYNYLDSEEVLRQKHVKYYDQKNAEIQQQLKLKKEGQDRAIKEQENNRIKISEQQIKYISDNEMTEEFEIIKKMPFRNYLLEYVVPELNNGLIEVSNYLPDDPIDFLAEYLYKKSF